MKGFEVPAITVSGVVVEDGRLQLVTIGDRRTERLLDQLPPFVQLLKPSVVTDRLMTECVN